MTHVRRMISRCQAPMLQLAVKLCPFMDCTAGYNQIQMALKDQYTKAFRTPKGIFCYKVIPTTRNIVSIHASNSLLANLYLRCSLFATLMVSMHRVSVAKSLPRLISVVDSVVPALIFVEDCIMYHAYRRR